MRRNVLALASFASVVFFSFIAGAQDNSAAPAPAAPEAKQGGLELGARLGYGLPLGNAVGGEQPGKLSDGYSGQVPIWIDAGYRINPNIYAGAYFAYGVGLINKDKFCSNGADCSGSIMRFGVNAHYHIMPDATFDPWVGLGIGYEIASAKASAQGLSSTLTYSGFEFLNLQVGGDYKINQSLAIGPFVALSVAQYSSAKVDSPIVKSDDTSIKDKAIHEWLSLGVRGAFDL